MPAVDYEKLSGLYDALVREDRDVAFFTAESRRASGRVLELMAGTGRVSLPIVAAGVELTCADSSPAMLGRLRQKLASRCLAARVVEQDVAQLDLESRFSLAFIAFHSFEELTQDAARESALRRILEHLVPGGRFLCTLHDPQVRLRQVGPDRDVRRQFTLPGTGRRIELQLSTRPERNPTRIRGMERFVDVDTGEVIVELPLCFRLTDEEEFKALVERAGFRVQALYGDYEYGPYTRGVSTSMIWALDRPGPGAGGRGGIRRPTGARST